MTAAELKHLRTLLGWSQVRLAQELYIHKDTVSKWERGIWPIPPLVAKVLRLLVG